MQFLEPRDRLFVRWALYTGARIHEIAALTVQQIPTFGEYEPGRHCSIPITVTKGSRERSLFAPSFLIDETRQYIRFDRRKIALDASRRGTEINKDALWLGRWGSQITTTHARLQFQAALQAANVRDGVFHDLRHTYAVTMLDRLMARSSDPKARAREPLVALKHLLGHSSLKSTERYLRAREAHLGDIFDDDLEAPEL